MLIPYLYSKDCAARIYGRLDWELVSYNIRLNGIAPGLDMNESVKELFYHDKQNSAAIMPIDGGWI